MEVKVVTVEMMLGIGLIALVIGVFVGWRISKDGLWKAVGAAFGAAAVSLGWGSVGTAYGAAWNCASLPKQEVVTESPGGQDFAPNQTTDVVPCNLSRIGTAIGTGGGIGLLLGWLSTQPWNPDRRRSSTEDPLFHR
jgi:hypothetical protein